MAKKQGADWRIPQLEGLAGAMLAVAHEEIDEYQLAQCMRAHADAIDPQFMRVFWVHVLALHHAIQEVSDLSKEEPTIIWRRALRHGESSHRTIQSEPERLNHYVKWEI